MVHFSYTTPLKKGENHNVPQKESQRRGKEKESAEIRQRNEGQVG